MYVIMDERGRFYAIDRSSGGYPYWTEYIGSAQMYKKLDDCYKVFDGQFLDDNALNMMSDGSATPIPMIHSTLGLNSDKKSGEGKLYIKEIEFKVVAYKTIRGELHESTTGD